MIFFRGAAATRDRKTTRRRLTRATFGLLFIIIAGFLPPMRFINPVEGAGHNSYHPSSFWYYPWGKSGTHKGVDIFATEGTPVRASSEGLTVYRGTWGRGGNVVLILGTKWRLHYYAHLQRIDAGWFSWVSQGNRIGTVGTTGNAKGKSPHLHYSIVTPIPRPWHIDGDRQGWKKMFYVNPVELLNEYHIATGR